MTHRHKFALPFLLMLGILWQTGCLASPVTTTAQSTVQLAPTPSIKPPDVATNTPLPATAVMPSTTPVTTVTSQPSDTTIPTDTPLPTATDTPVGDPLSVRFAVIGDYGGGGQPEADVASLVHSWEPDFVITTGDNNYPDGEWTTIDANIGQFYHQYIYPYTGIYGEGADRNRFFPTLGNHDWNTDNAQPYLEYFTLPGNERYYDVIWEPVHLFALDSDSREPDGVASSSTQAVWLQDRLANSTASWKIVFMHHPPYSSGLHGPVDWTVWPYAQWGATAVISGHDHTYERLHIDGIPFFINGLGGGSIYYFENIMEGSQVRYNADYGAMLVEASESEIIFQFINRQGQMIDIYTIQK